MRSRELQADVFSPAVVADVPEHGASDYARLVFRTYVEQLLSALISLGIPEAKRLEEDLARAQF